MIINNIFGFK